MESRSILRSCSLVTGQLRLPTYETEPIQAKNLNVHVMHRPKCSMTNLQPSSKKLSIMCMIRMMRVRIMSPHKESTPITIPGIW